LEIAVEIIICLLTVTFVFYPLVTEKSDSSVAENEDLEAQILKFRKRNVAPGAGSQTEISGKREQIVAPETDIEAQISKLRKQGVPPSVARESQISKVQERKNRTCPKCGSTNPADARFCSECATKLSKDS
jgi:hypothetical protein